MRRARSRFGMVGVVSLTAVLAIGACDEDTNSATDQVCDARTSLRDSVETVTSDISDGNFDADRRGRVGRRLGALRERSHLDGEAEIRRSVDHP